MTLDASLDDRTTDPSSSGLDTTIATHHGVATTWLEAAPTAALLVAADGTIRWANAAAERLLADHSVTGWAAIESDRSVVAGADGDLVGARLAPLLTAAAARGRRLDDHRTDLDGGDALVHIIDASTPSPSASPEQQRRFRAALLELSVLSHEISGDAAFYSLLARRAVEVIPSASACRVLLQRRDGRSRHDGAYDVIASSDSTSPAHLDGRLTPTLSSPVAIDGEHVALIEFEGRTDPTDETDGLGAHTLEMAALLSRLVGDLIRRRRLEAELRSERESFKHLAHHDPLTGLANRRRMERAIQEAIDEATQADEPVALLFLDLDDFKTINDDYGHDVGDRLLVAVADILRLAARSCDLVGRWGGDEFVILAPEISSRLELRRLAERVLAHLSQPLRLASGPGGAATADVDVDASLSIGAVWSRGDALASADLLRRADEALGRAKRSGKNTVRVDAA